MGGILRHVLPLLKALETQISIGARAAAIAIPPHREVHANLARRAGMAAEEEREPECVQLLAFDGSLRDGDTARHEREGCGKTATWQRTEVRVLARVCMGG